MSDPDPPEVPYNRFAPDDLILRDLLAIDRTILANERTLLSYCRTVLAMLAAGATLIHFIDAVWALVTGVAFIAGAIVVLGIGIWRFRRVQGDLIRARR